jgi:uncharacterized phage-like protein YoqJ
MANAKTLAFAAVHPHKLRFGLDFDHPAAERLKSNLRERLVRLIEEENVRHFISGMAMGADQICAEIVLESKRRYPGLLTLEAALPCKDQTRLWPQKQRDAHFAVLKKCDALYIACKEWEDGCAEKRSRYMTDRCDLLLVVRGANGERPEIAVEYAFLREKPILFVDS